MRSKLEEWQSYLAKEITPRVEANSYWRHIIKGIVSGTNKDIGIHLAVFVEPYLTYILNGKKTIESRFSKTRQAPYKKIAHGDILLLKKTGGDVFGLCEVSNVWFYSLDKEIFSLLRKNFSKQLCAQDPAFWKMRETSSFATLMQVKSVLHIAPVSFSKADRRGWVVLRTPKKSES